MKHKIEQGYPSPRWSGEILDCSMPMTFDTYDYCSYNCLYCFSFFQKALKEFNPHFTNHIGSHYRDVKPKCVNVNKIKKLFKGELEKSQFNSYIKQRIPMQWGGLGDPFDMFEKKYGVGLELLKFFKEIDYPICFSTKGTWWTGDERYTDLFHKQKNWNIKISIINFNQKITKKIEKGCPSPNERLNAINRVSLLDCGGVTLRLRPFVIGMSDKDNDYLYIIEKASQCGATALSTEFFCLEGRANENLKERYNGMSEALGFDILNFYRKNSRGSGYLRLNWRIKKPYIDKMQDLCNKLGMRFYVSDAHHKDRCCNGSCCGLDKTWNYCRGQFTEVLCKARERSDGRVYWSKDMEPYVQMYKEFLWRVAENFNTGGAWQRVGRWKQTMYDYIKEIWNSPKNAKSPYQYFAGLLRPVKIDKNGDVVYEYREYES